MASVRRPVEKEADQAPALEATRTTIAVVAPVMVLTMMTRKGYFPD
jgi:hypothetical protein